MKCENCGQNEANIKYTQIINGVKKEMQLCSKCSEQLGIGNLNFDMPMNISNFFADFLGDVQNQNEFIPSISQKEELKCQQCGMTYEEFLKSGKFGCGNCYETFSAKIDQILKNIHNGNRHTGRKGIPNNTKINEKQENIEKTLKNQNQGNNDLVDKSTESLSKLEKLQLDLKNAIKEERYEDAAQIRDKIKELQK